MRHRPSLHNVTGRRSRLAERGVTLMELVTAIALMSIVTAMGVSQLPELIQSVDRNNARHELEFDVARAQSEAAAYGTRLVLAVGSGGTSYSMGFDNLPYAAVPAIEQHIFTRRMRNNMTLSTSQPVVFDSRGFLVDANGTLTTTTITVSHRGVPTLSAVLYPTGHIDFD